MQKSDQNQQAMSTHRRVRSSTTLNRKYVKRPARQTSDVTVKVKRSPRFSRFAPQMTQSMQDQQTMQNKEEPMVAPTVHPMQATAINKMRERQMADQAGQQPAKKLTAKELKDQAIKKALATASKTTEPEAKVAKTKMKTKKIENKMHFGFGRVLLAFTCAASAVFAIVYFVNLNMPDISMRVAAMQSGFDAKYPSYVPRDYSLSGISSENEKMTLTFRNSSTEETITLIEERSSWDSNALLSNFVKDAYGENYTVIREQGLTIYISGSNACWVNGGVAYKLTSSSLSKKQIKTIATSL